MSVGVINGRFSFYCTHCFSCAWTGWTCLKLSSRSPRRCKTVLGFCCSSCGGRSSGRPSTSRVARCPRLTIGSVRLSSVRLNHFPLWYSLFCITVNENSCYIMAFSLSVVLLFFCPWVFLVVMFSGLLVSICYLVQSLPLAISSGDRLLLLVSSCLILH